MATTRFTNGEMRMEGGLGSSDRTAARASVAAALIVIAPDPLRGQSFALDKDELTLGRSPENHVLLDDSFVSRRHAVIRRLDEDFVIADAHSTAGVAVNGVRIEEPWRLADGDRIRLGAVELEVRLGYTDTMRARTAQFPVVHPPSKRRFDVQSQYGGVVSNVAGDQYNTELRIGPMRQRARRVMRTGFGLLIFGLTISAVGWANWATPILDCIKSPNPDLGFSSCVNPGAFLALAAGGLVMVVGIITVITSLFMKREVRREEARP